MARGPVRRDKMLGRWDATVREGVVALGEDTPAGAQLGETLAFFSFLQKELPALLDRWREYRAELPSARTEALAAGDPPVSRV